MSIMKNLPKTIGKRYRVVRPLGEGGGGAVFLVRDVLARQSRALKVLPSTATPGDAQAFQDEFAALADLRHSHVVRVYDFGFDPGLASFFFTSEYVAGEDFHTATRGVEWPQIRDLAVQILQGLEFIHAHGLLHNDLKSTNILVAGQSAKILDLGISTWFAGTEATGPLKGTLGYLAPEVILGSPFSVQSDLFAFGVMLARSLSGHFPFANESLEAFLASVRNGAKFKVGADCLPVEIKALLLRMLSIQPEQRPESVAEVLQVFLKGAPANLSNEQITPWRKVPYADPAGVLEKIKAHLFASSRRARPFQNVLVIEGVRGSGKTRALKELMQSVSFAGGLSYTITCSTPSSKNFFLWTSLIREAGLWSAQGDLPMRVLQGEGPLHPRRAGSVDWNQQSRHNLFYSFYQVLESISRKRSLVVLVDNLHFMDQDGLDFLRFIMRMPLENFQMVFTLDADYSRKIRAQAIVEEGPGWFRLPGFSEEQLPAFLASIVDARATNFPEKPAKLLFRLSRGLPGVVVPWVQKGMQHGWVGYSTGEWRLSAAWLQWVKSEVRQELGAWPKNSDLRSVLHACVLLSEPFRVRDLVRLTGQPDRKIRKQLKDLLDLGHLQVSSQQRWMLGHVAERKHLGHLLKKHDGLRKIHRDLSRRLAQGILQGEIYAHEEHALVMAVACLENIGKVAEAAALALAQGERTMEAYLVHQTHALFETAWRLREHLSPAQEEGLEVHRIGLLMMMGNEGQAMRQLQAFVRRPKINTQERWLAELKLAWLLGNRGKLQEAREHLENGLKHSDEFSPPILQSRFLAQLAFVLAGLGKPAEAQEKMQQAVAVAQRLAEPLWQARLLSRRAALGLLLGSDLNHAEKDILAALALLVEHADLSLEATLYHNLAQLRGLQGQAAAQFDAAEKSLRLGRRCGDMARIFHAQTLMGTLLFRQGNLQAAQDAFSEALRLSAGHEDVPRLVENHLQLIKIFLAQWDFAAAKRHLRQAQDLVKMGENSAQRNWVRVMAVALALEMNQRPDVQNLLQEDGAEQGGITDPLLEGANLLLFASAAHQTDKNELAMQNFAKAQEVFSRQGKPLECAEAMIGEMQLRLDVGQVLSQTQKERVGEASALFEKSGTFVQRIRVRMLEAWMNFSNLFVEDLEKRFHENLLSMQNHRSLWLDFLFLKGKLAAREKKFGLCLDLYQEAASFLENFLQALSPEEKKNFLDHPQRQRFLKNYDEVRGLPEVQERIVLDLRVENELLRQSHGLMQRLLLEPPTVSAREKAVFDIVKMFDLASAGVCVEQAKGFALSCWSDGLATTLKKPEEKKWLAQATQRFEQLTSSGNDWPDDVTFRVIEPSGDWVAPLAIWRVVFKSPLQARRFAPILLGCVQTVAGIVLGQTKRLEMARTMEQTSQRLREVTRELTSMGKPGLLHDFGRILTFRSKKMEAVFQLLDRVIPSSMSVLIHGETGTGKELIARTIHDNGPLKRAAFVVVNCGAIPENLVDSTLFGHRKGAFTGAAEDQTGLLTMANGGTVFFDEIGELPLAQQTRLLRVLETGEIRPVGSGGEPGTISRFRVIAATHRNLEGMVKQGLFRQDLFFRLAGMVVQIPPLRDRREDIVFLAKHFLEGGRTFSARAVQGLESYHWPGNVRELKNVVAAMAMLSRRKTLAWKDLPANVRAKREVSVKDMQNYEDAKFDFTVAYLEDILKRAQGKVSLAAQSAGLTREYFYNMLKKHHIHPHRFKP